MKLLSCIEQITGLADNAPKDQMDAAVSQAFDALVLNTSVEELRHALPDTWDFTVPTRLVFAINIHIQLLRQVSSSAEDQLKFATFLSAFYEEARRKREVDTGDGVLGDGTAGGVFCSMHYCTTGRREKGEGGGTKYGESGVRPH